MKTKNLIIIGSVVVVLGLSAMFIFRKPKDKGGDNGEDDKGVDAPTDTQSGSLIGKNVYPSKEFGFTNIRTSPKIDDLFMGDWGTNMLKKSKERPLGVIKEVVTGADNYNWYRIKLSKPEDGKTEGYVREDAVSFT